MSSEASPATARTTYRSVSGSYTLSTATGPNASSTPSAMAAGTPCTPPPSAAAPATRASASRRAASRGGADPFELLRRDSLSIGSSDSTAPGASLTPGGTNGRN